MLTIPTGWIVHNWHIDNLYLAEQNHLDYLIINYRYCADIEHDFAADKWRWVMYEISDPDKAMELFEKGIYFVESDNICSMLKHLPADHG